MSSAGRGALDAPCAVSYGPVTGSVYAGHRLIDVLIHGWDLATVTEQDPHSRTTSSRPAARSREPQIGMLRASGAFAGGRPVAPDAGAQARLLTVLGRRG
jgi:hypothetical protein